MFRSPFRDIRAWHFRAACGFVRVGEERPPHASDEMFEPIWFVLIGLFETIGRIGSRLMKDRSEPIVAV